MVKLSITENSGRLISLDAFRGITIAAMLLVNFPGNGKYVFSPLRHTVWNGITPTDLIAPFFLFIVGIAIAFTFSKKLDSGLSPSKMYSKLFVRSVKIFTVGMFLNILGLIPDFNFSDLRYTGTLHRIAIVYLVCGIIFLNTKWKKQVIIGAAVLIIYWLAMTLVPMPGYGKVMLEPGINLAAWIDSRFLPGRMWQGTWDPEGILSTFPSIVTGITGMLAGTLLLKVKIQEYKVIYLLTFGFISTILGVAWNWIFPLNENLWTSSFVLFTSGLASMTLATLIFLIDILQYKRYAQVGVIYGSNAISIYVLADIFAILFYGIKISGSSLNIHFFNYFTSFSVSPELVSMFYAMIFVGIMFTPAFILYKNKIFIKL